MLLLCSVAIQLLNPKTRLRDGRPTSTSIFPSWGGRGQRILRPKHQTVGFNELPAPVSTFACHAFLPFHPIQVSCTRVSTFPVSDGRSCLLFQGVMIGVSPSRDLKVEPRDLLAEGRILVQCLRDREFPPVVPHFVWQMELSMFPLYKWYS